MNPRARKSHIFTENLPGEVILYDKTNDKVHCLNKTAAAIWESCDGTKSVDDLAHIVEAKFGVSADRKLVPQALEELEEAGLLEAGSVMVPGAGLTSRREAVGKIAMAGTALVVTIVAAAPAAHASAGAPKDPPPLPIRHNPPEPLPPIGHEPPIGHKPPAGGQNTQKPQWPVLPTAGNKKH
jgi:hypothetical protein